MAASSNLSQRSSRRVAGLHPPSNAPPTDKAAHTSKPLPRRVRQQAILSNTTFLAGDDSPRAAKRQRISQRERRDYTATVASNSEPTRSSAPKALIKTEVTQSTTIVTKSTDAPHATDGDEGTLSKRATKRNLFSNGIHNEPSNGPVQSHDKRRQLRSQAGGSRFKSELSLFFPCYDEIISNEPKERGGRINAAQWTLLMISELLTFETPLLIEDDASHSDVRLKAAVTNGKGTVSKRRHSAAHDDSDSTATAGSPDAKLHNVQRLDFSSVDKAMKQVQEDPLSDGVYIKAHRKAERREKQLRNIEKSRAQHEKDNLERILEGLRGPDWLKVLGVSGITESEKKDYEPKRDFFVQEVAALIAKFQAWKEEEKRRKTGRELGLILDGATEGSREADEVADLPAPLETSMDDGISDGDPPDYSDVDMDWWAQRQLHQEAISATGGLVPSRARPEKQTTLLHWIEEPYKPFVSFYSKPHLRAAAVGKHRRSGRNATAFGRPLPEMDERQFELPPDILTPEAIVASARRSRRRKRDTGD
ncbi:MAG: hypothetical protein M1817_005099 [Caeruleum heppii]|nr:MAG: hypothetical protein M1817_005099 [Caeruleum heppii]